MATLPRLEEDTKSWADRLVDELENEIEKINQAANTGTATENFAPTNFTKTKSLNAGTANTAAVANVLCTVIEALRNKGILA
tara:strand:- start:28 stop:273 length:246 start_codon:yes stop_codon:yes gene_type:complete